VIDVRVVREVDPAARVAPDAVVGPYCFVGPDVTIGPATVLRRRVCVLGHTTIGSGNVFEEGCVVGARPQDQKYRGGPTLLIVGHRNFFGRRVTAHVGTETGGYLTRIGDENTFCEGSHIAHDCYVDDRTYLGRNVLLAGHIRVHTGAVVEDLAGVHHFVTIGRHARVGPRTPVRRDVCPYTNFYSDDYDRMPPAVRGANEAGIGDANLRRDEQRDLRRALAELFEDEAALQTKIEVLMNLGVEGEVAELCAFCQRSLQGVYGRYRERFRGQVPPEAQEHLPPEWLAEARRALA